MLRVIDRQIKLRSEIIPILRERLNDFVGKFGTTPAAWLLGPKDFLSLHEEIAKQMGVKRSELETIQGLTFLGMPVFPKVQEGIDIVIPPQLVGLYCIASSQKEPKG